MSGTSRFYVAFVLVGTLLLFCLPAAAQWQQINGDGFGVRCDITTDLVEFNGYLFASTRIPGRLFRLGDLSEESWFHWTEIDLPIPEIVPGAEADPSSVAIWALAVFTPEGDRFPWLFAAIEWGNLSFVIRAQTTASWSLASEVWDCGADGTAVEMTVFDGRLYVSVGDLRGSDPDKMRLHRTANGRDWETVPPGEIALGPGDHWIEDLEVYDGHLYAGASGHNESAPGDHIVEVWRSPDGMEWSRIGELYSLSVSEVESMEVFDGHLYVGTKNHYGILEETVVPELWRFDGREWEQINTAGQFMRNSLHVDALYAHHGALYAGIGGGPGGVATYGRVYRSVDGEAWEQVTPEGIYDHPENTYMASAILGIGEYVYVSTAGREEGTDGSQVWRMATLRSDAGPCLAQHDGEPYLIHVLPRPEENLWEAVLRDGEDDLAVLGAVHDENVARTWAFSDRQPVAYGYSFMGLLVGSQHLQLVYADPDDSIQQMRKTYAGGTNWTWDTPEAVADAVTTRAPGATAHNWIGPSGPQLTVAYTDSATGRIHYRVKQGTRWSAEYTLPEGARTSNGPEIVSFDDTLYVFYRGYGSDDWLYVARKVVNTPSNTEWEIARLPRAFTRRSETDRAVAAVAYEGALIVAYVGHNNDSIWLRRSPDGVNWDRLGYVRGPVTENNPDLTVSGGDLYLAFRPTGDPEICFGTLEVDPENDHDTPGHVWRSLRPMRCCPGCILTIMDVIIPLIPLPED